MKWHFNYWLFLLIIIVITSPLKAQEDPEQYVRREVKQISTIDPASTDTIDMSVLSVAINDARIVMLGEQDHGDANTFLAKLRIIKYLHEKMGFNVIAFESDFFALNEGWVGLSKDSASMVSFLNGNIFPIWTYCPAAAPLFRTYIPQSFSKGLPLQVTGFDDQMILFYSGKYLKQKLDSVFRSLQLPLTKDPGYADLLATIDSLRTSYGVQKPLSASYARWEGKIAQIRNEIGKVLPVDDFWVRVIDNLISETNAFQVYDRNHQDARRTRDYQMAENLLWLANKKYPSEKIIVWAANYHIARYADSVSEKKNLATMGHYFSKMSTAPKTYILGFDSYQGSAGRLGYKSYSISKPRKKSFENWIPSNWAYAFVDFNNWQERHAPNATKFFMKGLGHMSFETNWQHYYDGVFFIREMTSCSK